MHTKLATEDIEVMFLTERSVLVALLSAILCLDVILAWPGSRVIVKNPMATIKSCMLIGLLHLKMVLSNIYLLSTTLLLSMIFFRLILMSESTTDHLFLTLALFLSTVKLDTETKR